MKNIFEHYTGWVQVNQATGKPIMQTFAAKRVDSETLFKNIPLRWVTDDDSNPFPVLSRKIHFTVRSDDLPQ